MGLCIGLTYLILPMKLSDIGVRSRNPCSGERVITGEYLPKAIENDLGIFNRQLPLSMIELQQSDLKLHQQLSALCTLLELQYADMQAIEFSVEDRRLYVLKV